MKLELLKSLITDLHLAGIYDIPANVLFDGEEIENSDLLNNIFGKVSTNQMKESELDNIDKGALNNEISNLFASLGTPEPVITSETTDISVIAAKNKFAKAKPNQPSIVDPRLVSKTTPNAQATTQEKTTPVIVEKIIPENYITITNKKDGKYALLLDYKNENELKSLGDFELLNKILKAINVDYNNLSIIFIDNSYKKATLDNAKNLDILVKHMQENVKCINQEFFICLGQSCLNLIAPSVSNIRSSNGKLIDLDSDKKLIAGYSLSALQNSPKYKAMLWQNLLLTVN